MSQTPFERTNDVIDAHMIDLYVQILAERDEDTLFTMEEVLMFLRVGWAAGVRDQRENAGLYDQAQEQIQNAFRK
jgi:hypothetical protein